MGEPKSLRVAYGEALVKVGEHNDKVVVLDADLSHATMTCLFAEKYPERFFNMGIAEQNLICAAAGMAYSGLTLLSAPSHYLVQAALMSKFEIP